MPGLIGEDALNIESVPFDIAIKGSIYFERHQFSSATESKEFYDEAEVDAALAALDY